ncbi:MAG: hypothetical protein AMK70_02950 [Nitrospira bacterium SG8_35_1]|nr:MAG: hypothetical protein AMK70_02950 [Nitrospira bacterium SG8_35_1]
MRVLSDMDEGKRVRVLEIPGGKGARQHLSAYGIHLGDILLIKRQSAWGGPILIEVHGSEVALGRGIASRVQVEEL